MMNVCKWLLTNNKENVRRRTANILIINAMSNYDVKMNRKSDIESDRRRRHRESRKWSKNDKSLCFKNEFEEWKEI